MVSIIRKKLPFIFLILSILFFYAPLIFSHKLPIPLDTIVGLYSPYRDYYSKDYPNGIPFKNYLITDPVRQTYIWKELSTDIYKKLRLPTWNPYEMAGKPLAGNMQSGVFYPLNIIFLIFSFPIAWSIFIAAQSLLLGCFTFFYLKNLKLKNLSALMGSFAISFSGFSISWLEWGNVIHAFLWLPLILLSIDKVFENKRKYMWYLTFIFSVISSFFAGHLQVFFYVFSLSILYFLFRILSKKSNKIFWGFIISLIIIVLITSIQWLPTFQFIMNSSRSIDQNYRDIVGWFIPWQNLVQFLVPDFFGNPSTLNYFGVWNYAEFVGYIGIIPLLLVPFAFFKINKTVIFFAIAIFVAMLFSLPTGISSIPFILNIPFISSAQPTRLILIVSFSLSVLSSFGFEYIVYNNSKFELKKIIPFLVFISILVAVWVFTYFNLGFFKDIDQSAIAKRNLVFPTVILIAGSLLFSIYFLEIKFKKIKNVLLITILALTFIDGMRFAQKFTPFVDKGYLYPLTKTINFLKSDKDIFRIASLDRRILAPNIATHYKIQSIEGYDPLYINNYAEYIAALERGKADIKPPFGFNRIITPHNYSLQLFDLLNVKYVLSFDELPSPRFSLVFKEGNTKIYKNNSYLKRAFFVKKTVESNNIESLFKNDLSQTAIITGQKGRNDLVIGKVKVVSYQEDKVVLESQNEGEGFMVITDSYYSTWKAYIDGKESDIIKTDHTFRGLYIPSGKHIIILNNYLI